MENITPSNTPRPLKLLDQLREQIRLRHYSIRTEAQYVQWVRRFVLFHGKRHPREMGAVEVTAFLTDLAVNGKVAASTQNQALSALLFLYREVLNVELPWMNEVVRAKRPARLPVVLSRAEVTATLSRMHGGYALMARLLYGTGMRLMECVRAVAGEGCGFGPGRNPDPGRQGGEGSGDDAATKSACALAGTSRLAAEFV